MRIAILTVLLLLLLGPSLRSGAAASSPAPLHPTPAFPGVSGTVQVERQGERMPITVALGGVPTTTTMPAIPVYVVWLVDEQRRLYNLGSLTVNRAGDALSTFTPIAATSGTLMIAISIEPRADLTAPSAPRETVIASGQIVPPRVGVARGLGSDFGPAWFAPIVPATLGLFLLRHAARTRRAELRARRAQGTSSASAS